jgi:hypothetical protein
MLRYPQEQILKIYRELPENLKKALDDEKTINTLENVSKQYKLSGPQTSALVDLTGNVLLGLLPPDQFQQALKQEAGIKLAVAKKIAFAIYRFVFFPVKQTLAALYDTKVNNPAEAKESEPDSRPKRKDSYREPI